MVSISDQYCDRYYTIYCWDSLYGTRYYQYVILVGFVSFGVCTAPAHSSGGNPDAYSIVLTDTIQPMEVVAFDYVGPLPETMGKKRFIISAIDYFSRFVD